jgi:hypothetical protein
MDGRTDGAGGREDCTCGEEGFIIEADVSLPFLDDY